MGGPHPGTSAGVRYPHIEILTRIHFEAGL